MVVTRHKARSEANVLPGPQRTASPSVSRPSVTKMMSAWQPVRVLPFSRSSALSKPCLQIFNVLQSLCHLGSNKKFGENFEDLVCSATRARSSALDLVTFVKTILLWKGKEGLTLIRWFLLVKVYTPFQWDLSYAPPWPEPAGPVGNSALQWKSSATWQTQFGFYHQYGRLSQIRSKINWLVAGAVAYFPTSSQWLARAHTTFT